MIINGFSFFASVSSVQYSIFGNHILIVIPIKNEFQNMDHIMYTYMMNCRIQFVCN